MLPHLYPSILMKTEMTLIYFIRAGHVFEMAEFNEFRIIALEQMQHHNFSVQVEERQ